MRILVIGSGGREHALCHALARSARVETLRCAPGNAGIARDAELVDIAADDLGALEAHAVGERYDLVVIGPEAPLVAGLADRLGDAGLSVFGPRASAARLEGSKIFAKEFMTRHRIPTASYRVFDDLEAATSYLGSAEARYPCVLKADGLAAGKGVLIVDDADAAVRGARAMLEERRFGDAGARILVEECLVGREASFFALCDGSGFVSLAACQDYKRAHDGDRGPNTGGMGTYSPSAYVDDALAARIAETIVEPTVRGLAAEGAEYRGVLFVGLMLTAKGPEVLEYNCRFGDPETQVLVPRLDGDWAEVLDACATGRLGSVTVGFRPEAAVCVVMAAGGYPGDYVKGAAITGLEEAAEAPGVTVYHAGTRSGAGGGIETSGGRVLGVTALGGSLTDARRRAYDAVDKIDWDGARCRRDIAADALVNEAREETT